MEEFEYKKLRFNLLNKYMEILEVEQQLYPLLKEEEQNKDKIIEMVETTHYNQLQADFNKMKKEWNNCSIMQTLPKRIMILFGFLKQF